MKYSAEVLTRVREPQRVGALPADDEDVGTGEIGTLDEGTVTRIQVRVSGETVVQARFKVFGCSAAIASASLVAEWLEGASLEEARAITTERVVQVLQLLPEREHVARMAFDAAQQAITSVEGRRRKAEHDRDHGKRGTGDRAAAGEEPAGPGRASSSGEGGRLLGV